MEIRNAKVDWDFYLKGTKDFFTQETMTLKEAQAYAAEFQLDFEPVKKQPPRKEQLLD